MKSAGLTTLRPTPVQSHHHPAAKETAAAETQPEARVEYRFGNVPLQRKLQIGATDDPLEREADAAAARVMRMPESESLEQPKCSCGGSCDKCRDKENQNVRMKSFGPAGPGRAEAPPVVHDAMRSPGQPLDSATRAFMEPRFGVDFGSVRVHMDQTAQRSSAALRAQAFAIGRDVFFAANRWNPQSNESRALLAHELAHTLQQGRCPGRESPAADPGLNPWVQRRPDDRRTTFPWNGRIDNTTSASLRRTPSKDPANPHVNTVADLPTGTPVLVVGASHGWMHVQADVEGRTVTGYVSQELITFVSASAFDVPETKIEIKFPTVAEAFVELKRAETRKAAAAKKGSTFTPTEEEQGRIDRAIIVLNGTKKYTVDETTFAVNFVAPPGNVKQIRLIGSFPKVVPARTQITTIEDFILFVEQVEKQYPSASPQEVASEVRQLWYAGPNWETLIASYGISDQGKEVDIANEPNPIASRFDVDQMGAPPPPHGQSKHLELTTRMGMVDVDHIMAGIDAHFSGPPASFADSLHGHQSTERREIGFDVMKDASQGDVRDFATWSGDIGQAYAEYLIGRYKNFGKIIVKDPDGKTLRQVAAMKTSAAEISADIYGYVAVAAAKDVPPSASPTGGEVKVSNMLRDIFLVNNTAAGAATPQNYFERESGKSNAELKSYVHDRSLRFARAWFGLKMVERRGTGYTDWPKQPGWTKRGIVENTLDEFDMRHNHNEKTAALDDKLEWLEDDFLNRLAKM